MMTAIDSVSELDGVHKREMKDYLESFFRRLATPESIKKTFVDGCPATRARI
jgi:predicted Zn-dependent protease